MDLSDIKDELISLWEEKVELEARLGKINAKIGKIQRQLDNNDVIEIVSSILVDDKQFNDWFIPRQKRLFNMKRKQELKEKIKNGDLSIAENTPNTTYLYALYYKEELVYVGITKKLKSRIQYHKRSKKLFDNYKVLSMFNDRFMALKEENNLIIKHKPKYNKQVF